MSLCGGAVVWLSFYRECDAQKFSTVFVWRALTSLQIWLLGLFIVLVVGICRRMGKVALNGLPCLFGDYDF